MSDSDALPVKAGVDVSYSKVNHISRYETDTAEECKPKFIRKRVNIFSEKVLVFHYRGNDDYFIEDIEEIKKPHHDD